MAWTPVFDEKFAKQLIGKTILVGLRVFDSRGTLLEQTQFHGQVVHATQEDGIVVRRSDGQPDYVLPPDTGHIQPAPRGEYRERSSGKVITDPDFMTTWSVTRRPSQ